MKILQSLTKLHLQTGKSDKLKFNGGEDVRECKKAFIKNSKQQRTKNKALEDTPVIRYIHTCNKCNIGLIVTPETEAIKKKLSKTISKTCKEHCRKKEK